MQRITGAERKRFHKILDDSLDKLNSPKNRNKKHWKYSEITELALRQKQECKELLDEVFRDKFVHENKSNIESEGYDNINFPLFIIDNLRGNK